MIRRLRTARTATKLLLATAVALIAFGGVYGFAASLGITSSGLGAGSAVVAASEPGLAPPWKISVDVLNGSGDINYTRQVASRIGSMGYLIARVARADRFDYPRTAVYFEPGSQGIGVRLARQLGVGAQTLPPGTQPRKLVVIVGPPRGPGS